MITLLLLLLLFIPFLLGIRNYIYSAYSMFLGYTLLQLYSSYNSWHMWRYFLCSIFCTLTLVLFKECNQCPFWLFSIVPWCRTFPACCAGIYGMMPQLLLVSLLFYVSRLLSFCCKVFTRNIFLIYYYYANSFLFLLFFLTVHSHSHLNPSDHRGHLAIQTDSKLFVILFNQSLNAQFCKLCYTNWPATPKCFDAQDFLLRNTSI
jgi:hypothetical protein